MENGEDKQIINAQTNSQPVIQNTSVVNANSMTQPSASSFNAPSSVQTTTPVQPQVVAPVTIQTTPVVQQATPVVTPQVAPAVESVQPQVAPVVSQPQAPTVETVNPMQTQVTSTVNQVDASANQVVLKNTMLSAENPYANVSTFKAGERDYLKKKDEKKVQINSTEEVKTEEEKKQEEDEIISTGINNKASIILIIIFVVFLVSGFIFYFIIISPKRAFFKSVEDIKILYAVPINNFINNDRERMEISIGFALDTEQAEFEKSKDLKSVEYIDGDYLEGIIDLDLVNNDSKVTLKAQKSTKNLEKLNIDDENIVDKNSETQKMLDFSMYNVNNKIYVGPIDYYNYNDVENFGKDKITFDKKVQIDLIEALTDGKFDFNFSKDKLYDIEKIVAITIDKFVQEIDSKEITRRVVSRKALGSSKIFVKSSLDLDNKRLNEIYHGILQDYYDNKEEVFTPDEGTPETVNILAILSNISGLPISEIKEYLMELINNDLSAKRVQIDLYLSFSTRSGMGGIEVYIDDKYYYKADVINEQFVVDMGIIENKGTSDEHILAEMQIDFNQDTGSLDGVFSLDNKNTRLAITIDFDLLKDYNGNEIGNTLLLGFYNNDTYKEETKRPFARLDCKLEYYDNNTDPDKVKFDLRKEVEGSYSLPNINIAGMPKSSVQGVGKISLSEANKLLKFTNNFVSHAEYLIDHLLYNKDGALDNKKSIEITTTKEETAEENKEEESSNTEENVTEEVSSSEENSE